MSYEKIVLITRKTRLEGLVERFNTHDQARFYIEHNGGDFAAYEREHNSYYKSLSELRLQLSSILKLQVIERQFLPNFIFSEKDIVVTVGIDGLVVNTAKYLDGQPLVAVNPDPQHIDGVLLPFNVSEAPHVVRRVLKGHEQARPVSMAEARLNDGQVLLAFNDLFIGVRSHISARYSIRYQGIEENHSSSGIIVSTGAGATGWMSSLFNMATGIWGMFGNNQEGLKQPDLSWEAERLIFVVREPFASKTSQAGLVCGVIEPGSLLSIESQAVEGGLIFSDGVETDFLAFNAGSLATVALSDKKTRLVVK